jgi:bla regulator protein blaR1
MTEILMIAAKATVAIALTFALASVGRDRASLKHLLFGALFAFLLLLPFASRLVRAPRALDVSVTVPRTVIASVAAAATPDVGRASARPDGLEPILHWNLVRDIYIAIAALLVGWLGAGVWRLRRMAANGEVWLEGTARMNELATGGGIRRAALVLISDETAVPLTFGFRHATILLPRSARAWTDGALSRALRHELEHVRREDWIAQLVARFACAVYWPHPLVWAALRRFCFEAERACDDAVVVAFTDAEDYATQLVTLAKEVRHTTVPALGMASRSRLSQRVRALLDPAQQRGPMGRFAAAAVIALTLLMLVTVAPAHLIAATAAATVAGDAPASENPRVIASRNWSAVGEKLAEAGEAGRKDIIEEFLNAGFDVNTVAEGDGTALIGASKGGHTELVRWLIERGADVSLASKGDGNPLINAARNGHIDIIRILLDAGANINEVVPGDENPIIQAASHGREKAVKLLIERGADVNARAYEDGQLRTALRMAHKHGHEHVERMLLAAGARE